MASCWRTIDVPLWMVQAQPPGREGGWHTARALYREEAVRGLDTVPNGSIRLVYMAEFIYVREQRQILKNTLGSTEEVVNYADKYLALKNNKNEQVRRLLEKVELLAAL